MPLREFFLKKMTEVDPEDARPLIPLRRLLMLYTMARKNETNLIQLLTEHIEQIKRDLSNSPNRELMERLISEYPYPRNFDEELDVDESSYEVDSFNYDSRFYS